MPFCLFLLNFVTEIILFQCATIFTVLRLIIPNCDRERPAYGIKAATIGKLFVRILAIDANSEIAKRLTQKDVSTGNIASESKNNSDYADMVYQIIKNRVHETGTKTVFEVNHYLNNIAECYQSNKRASKF